MFTRLKIKFIWGTERLWPLAFSQRDKSHGDLCKWKGFSEDIGTASVRQEEERERSDVAVCWRRWSLTSEAPHEGTKCLPVFRPWNWNGWSYFGTLKAQPVGLVQTYRRACARTHVSVCARARVCERARQKLCLSGNYVSVDTRWQPEQEIILGCVPLRWNGRHEIQFDSGV